MPMKTFYIVFQVSPTIKNQDFHKIEGAFAHCWVNGETVQGAVSEAKFFVRKYDWKIDGLDRPPIEITREDFIGKDEGLALYDKCQVEGTSMAFVGWSRDGESSSGPVSLEPSFRLNLSDFINNQRKFSLEGRCLHYDSGFRCNQIIRAHSIQKNQSLTAIAVNALVYVLDSQIGTLRKTHGKIVYKKKSINKVSTFLGFCSRHDNSLFEPIDNNLLLPTDEQVLLYAYRSLCREVFVKENAFRFLKDFCSQIKDQPAILTLISDALQGTAVGLKNLMAHKQAFDESLRTRAYKDIKYVIFVSRAKPFVAFSGLIWPDFDFMGRPLQAIADTKSKVELITFCSAPMTDGKWGFLFAWHQTSSKISVDYMRSLATMMHDNFAFDDMLFRLIVRNCENHAFSPEWWENLEENKKEEIVAAIGLMANPFEGISPDYLKRGLEGIAKWNFDDVISVMD